MSIKTQYAAKLRLILQKIDDDEQFWEALSVEEQGEVEVAISEIEHGINQFVNALPQN